MNCAKCPWSPILRRKISDEAFEDLKKRTKTILGYTPTEKPCLLCLTPEEKIGKEVKHWHANFRRGCQIRKCVTNMDVKNCAYCSRFPCAFERDHAGHTRETMEKQHDRPMTDEEYHTVIEPFEGIKRLERIRSTLTPDEIMDPVTVPPPKTRIVEFPKSLADSQAKFYKLVHTMLCSLKQSTLGLEDVDILPQQQRLKNRIKHIFRFLWIFAAIGKSSPTDEEVLVVEAETFLDNRVSERGLGTWSVLEQIVFPILTQLGVQVEMVELSPEWKTPMGGLRKRDWEIHLSFTKEIGGAASLKAFQTYGSKLQKRHGKRGFRYFLNVDMRMLTKP
jgi:hypothetical protein